MFGVRPLTVNFVIGILNMPFVNGRWYSLRPHALPRRQKKLDNIVGVSVDEVCIFKNVASQKGKQQQSSKEPLK
jgi:hypothetical protein